MVRLWEEETEPFLQSTGLLPYAALTNTDDRVGVLQEVAQKIDQMSDRREQGNLMVISAVMGALSLDSDVIQRILRRDIMQASPMYQEMKAWAKEDAERELRLTVEHEIGESIALQKARSIALNMLQENLPMETIARITGLTIAQIQELQGDRIF